jgi:hypothetical protein
MRDAMTAELLLPLFPDLMKALSPLLPAMAGAFVAATPIIAVTLELNRRMSRLERQIARALTRFEQIDEGRDRSTNHRREDQGQPSKELRRELESLRSMIGRIPGETARQVKAAPPEPGGVPPSIPAPAAHPLFEEPPEPEDGLARLLAIANRIVQQSSTTLDAFRASAGSLATHVAAWPGSADGPPAAFIVEHRGSHYAVPNVVKPARLPKEWFNRSDFGVNDEIQRVVSLPRLRRRGDGYDVQELGVFGR